MAIQANCEMFGLAILNVFQEYPRGQTTVVGRRVIVRPKCALHMQIFSFPLQRLCKIKNLNSYLYMLINGRHTHCLHVPFLFHWQIYGQQPSSTSSPCDKRKKAEWTSKKQTSVDDVKNKTSILNRITIVFHHCVSLIWTFQYKQITYEFDDLFEIHEAFRRGLIWKNASQIQFHQFYNLLRDVCY